MSSTSSTSHLPAALERCPRFQMLHCIGCVESLCAFDALVDISKRRRSSNAKQDASHRQSIPSARPKEARDDDRKGTSELKRRAVCVVRSQRPGSSQASIPPLHADRPRAAAAKSRPDYLNNTRPWLWGGFLWCGALIHLFLHDQHLQVLVASVVPLFDHERVVWHLTIF